MYVCSCSKHFLKLITIRFLESLKSSLKQNIAIIQFGKY